MKYFMQASSNITGQKNCANFWITSEQSIFRAKPLVNNWKDMPRCVIFRYDPKQMERDHKKPSRLPSNYTSYRKHDQRSKSDSRIKKTSQLPRGSGPREARLAHMALSQLEMVLRGKPNLRVKFHTMASPKISRRACLGKPRSIHS